MGFCIVSRKNCLVFFSVCVLLVCSVYSQPVQISGKVVDESSQSLANVSVEIVSLELKDVTDAEGNYSFSVTPVQQLELIDPGQPVVSGSKLVFKLEHYQEVQINIRNIQGRNVLEWSGGFESGNNSVSLNDILEEKASGMLLVEMLIDHQKYFFRGMALESGAKWVGLAKVDPVYRSLAKKAFAPDSLHFSLKGYEDEILRVSGLEVGTQNDVVMKQGLGFESYFVGSGRIYNLLTQDTILISKEERVHVILLPEGYSQQDIDDGKYDRDVDDWYNDVFSLSPYDFYKESFVIWKYPVASSSRTGEGTTHFQIPIDAFSGDLNVTARETWDILDKFPFNPKHYGGTRLRNFVVQFLVYNPTTGGSGYSGRATSLRNPNNSSQRVGIAIAKNQQHEFTHTFAQVSDEYFELDHPGMNSTRQTDNIAHTTNCSELQWKHLLFGGEYNKTTDSLVGAFGSRENGRERFHSEFKCLMNGSHENATIFGGSNNLRVNRFCNWCREMVAFRVYYNALILRDGGSAFDDWTSVYRQPHYDHFGLAVPQVIPQENSVGTAWFQPCN